MDKDLLRKKIEEFYNSMSDEELKTMLSNAGIDSAMVISRASTSFVSHMQSDSHIVSLCEKTDKDALIKQTISILYTINESEKVFQFLVHNKELLPIILSASAKISNYFPGNPTLELQAKCFEGDRQLCIYIKSNLPDAYERLEKLDHEWWIGVYPSVSGKLNIDLGD